MQTVQTVQAFCGWYPAQLADNQDPLHDQRVELRRWVSEELLGEIQRLRDSPDGLDADPFIQAQDCEDDRSAHISATLTRTQGAAATVKLILGPAGGALPWRQTVTLLRSGEGWKIRKVRRRS